MAKFKKGQSGNKSGRPKGTGSFQKARNIVLDVFFENEKDFREKMKVLCKKNSVGYYLKFILPLMPKQKEESEVSVEKVKISLGNLNDY